MKLAVFSNSSFSNGSVRLGLQIMASQLAERGHEVDYFALPTHPADVFSPTRRSSCIRGWLKGGDHNPVPVSNGLEEYFLRTPFSKSRRYWWCPYQMRLYSILAPTWMKERRYDVCIRDTAMSGVFSDKVQASARVLRLNDNPDGLFDDMHPMVINHLKRQITVGAFDETWPVDTEMLSKIQGLDSSIPATAIPNGVFLERFDAFSLPERRPRSAVYVGTFNHWFDVDLVAAAAHLLQDWRIDLYGPYSRRLRPLLAQRNVVHRGALPFDRVPETLSQYRVGLIPFSGGKAILETMDPLKANQYLAAGLGIASTPYGSLRRKLNGFARFGDTPASFAAAVLSADRECGLIREREEVRRHLLRVSWSAVLDLVEERLHRLIEKCRSGS